MITYKEALQRIEAHSHSNSAVRLSTGNVAGLYLAEDVPAPIDHPIFNQSAMDGYAFRHSDYAPGSTFTLCGEIAAGAFPESPTPANGAWRIFTGACVPDDCDTVIMQEEAQQNEDQVTFSERPFAAGANVRLQGEQIKTGDVALQKGAKLDAAAIGFLESLGIKEVSVIEAPTISVCVTGSEFATSPDDLKKGKIYESNSSMLAAAIQDAGYKANVRQVNDEPEVMERLFSEMANAHDVLIFTGGVSVGKYDYTKPTLEKIGFKEVFHKVNQKPGKPLLFMEKDGKVAFGLPGNPRAALLCFYIYVLPALRMKSGAKNPWLTQIQLPLLNDLRKRSGRTHFMSAKLESNGAYVSGGQGSHMLQSLSGTEGVVVFHDAEETLAAGDMVDVFLLPKS